MFDATGKYSSGSPRSSRRHGRGFFARRRVIDRIRKESEAEPKKKDRKKQS